MVSDAQLVALMATQLTDYGKQEAVALALSYLTEAKRQVREAERAAARENGYITLCGRCHKDFVTLDPADAECGACRP